MTCKAGGARGGGVLERGGGRGGGGGGVRIEWFFINNIIDITQKRNGYGLRSTMTQTRLNNFAIFNIHKLK